MTLDLRAAMLRATSMLFLAVPTAHAVEVKWVVGIGTDYGRDTLFSVNQNGSNYSVKANEGIVLYGGVAMLAGSFETQATIGTKSGFPPPPDPLSQIGNANAGFHGDVTLKSFPIELMEFYRVGEVRAGIGVVYQNAPRLVVDVPGNTGSLANGTYHFNDTTGTVVQIGWVHTTSDLGASVDLRYTFITYRQSDIANPKKINGDSIGLYASLYF